MSESSAENFKVFISYRRQTNEKDAAAIYKDLTFNGITTFLDKQEIRGGEKWKEVIKRKMSSCKVVLVLMGKDFHMVQDPESGEQRIFQRDDVVREEIRLALELEMQRSLIVIPVLVDDAVMPKPLYLPKDIRSLTEDNALSFSAAEPNGGDVLLETVTQILSEERESALGDIDARLTESSSVGLLHDRSRRLVGDLPTQPHSEVPTIATQSPTGMIGALRRGSGTWLVVLEGDELTLENPESLSHPRRSLQFTPSSGVLSADGEHIVVADEGCIRIAAATGDQIQLRDPIPLEGTHKMLGAWQSGNFLYLVRSATSGAEQVKVRMGDLSLVPWQLGDEFGPEPAWKSVVHCADGTVAVGGDGRLLTSGGCAQLMAWGPMTGWTALDYSTSLPQSGNRLEVLAGLRSGETGAVELLIAWRSNDAWKFGPTMDAGDVDAVMIVRPAMSPQSTTIFLRSGSTSSQLTLAALLSPGQST